MALLRKSLRQRRQATEDRRSSTIRNILSRLKRHFSRVKPTIPPAEELTGAQIVANPWDYMNHVLDISRQSGDPNAVAGRLGYTTPPPSRPRESEVVQGEYPRSAERLRFPLPPDYFKLAPDFTKHEDHPRMRPLPPIPLAHSPSGGEWDNVTRESSCVRMHKEKREGRYSPPPSPPAKRKTSFGHESAVTWLSIPSDERTPTPPYRRKARATMKEPLRQDSFQSVNSSKRMQNRYGDESRRGYVMRNETGEVNTIPFPPFFPPPPGLNHRRNNASSHQHPDQAERSQSSCSHVATLNDDTESDSESEYLQADHLEYLDAHDDNDVNEEDDVGDIAFEFKMLQADFEQQRTIVQTLQAHLHETQRMIVRQNAQIQRLTRSVRWLSSLTVFEEFDQMTQAEQDTLNASSQPQVRRNISALAPRRRTTHKSAKWGSLKENIPSHVGPIPPSRFLENEFSRSMDMDNNTFSSSDTMNDDDYEILKKPQRYSDMMEIAGQEQKFAQATLKPLPDVSGLTILTSIEDDIPLVPPQRKMLIVPIYDTPETPNRLKPEAEMRSKLHNYDDSQTRGVTANHVRMCESRNLITALHGELGAQASTRVRHEIDVEMVDDDMTPKLADFVKIGPPPRPYKSSFQGRGIGMETPQGAHEQIMKSSGAIKLRPLPDFHDMVVYQLGNEMNSNDSNVPYEMSTSSTLTWV